MTTINNALAAYAAAAKSPMSEGESPDSAAAAAASGTDFASVLKDAAKVAVGTMKEAEQQSTAAISGKADIREVVAAVSNAEATLQTVVNVRDKVISAYSEIMRMPM